MRITCAIDKTFSLTRTLLPFIAQAAHVGHWIWLVPTLARREASKAIRRTCRLLAENDRVIGDQDVEAVASFDAKRSPGLARDRDLVLGADLNA
jgi:hypothetical protein